MIRVSCSYEIIVGSAFRDPRWRQSSGPRQVVQFSHSSGKRGEWMLDVSSTPVDTLFAETAQIRILDKRGTLSQEHKHVAR